VFAGASSYLAGTLFGVSWRTEVAQISESQVRANEWVAVCMCFGGQGRITARDSSEPSPQVSGHIPGVIFKLSNEEEVGM
jgi:hypothetical protein